MTYFPQPNPAQRARRVRLPGSVVVEVRSKGSQPVRAKLHVLSVTGGLLVLSEALEQGDFVEVAFQTSYGAIRGMAELLPARSKSKSGACNPFGLSPWRMKTTPDCSRLWNHSGTRLLLGRASPASGKAFSDRESLSCRPLSPGETASPPPCGHCSLPPSPTPSTL